MRSFDSENFPVLRGERVVLRQIVPDDIETVFVGLSDPTVIAHYGVSFDSLQSTQRQMDWFEQIYREGTGVWWAICDPLDRNRMIGATGFNDISREHWRAEVGYWLLPAYWGRGLASESLSAILDYGFNSMGLHRVGAEVDVDNPNSSKLLERLGFRYEGTRRGYERKDGVHLDLMIYGRLASDPGPSSWRNADVRPLAQ